MSSPCHRSSPSSAARLIALAAVLLVGAGAERAWAQPADPADGRRAGSTSADEVQNPTDDGGDADGEADGDVDGAAESDREVENAVAAALLARSNVLYGSGDHVNSKTLLLESLRRSPTGPSAPAAMALLRLLNRSLEVADPYDGAPAAALAAVRAAQGSGQAGALGDPYGETTEPLNGDESSEGRGVLLEPDGGGEPGGDVLSGDVDEDKDGAGTGLLSSARRDRRGGGQGSFSLYGGILGFVTGMALVGPSDDGEVSGGSLLLGALSAGGGMLLGNWLAKNDRFSDGQARMIGWIGAWSGTATGFLSDLVTGIDSSSANEITGGIALGSLAGTAMAVAVMGDRDPSVDDIAVVNSLGLYGLTGSLLLGVALDPTESEAYSINALL
ncbi:MAG: hypothetical protein AAGC55_25780, partial [Myxococcota bacterium]